MGDETFVTEIASDPFRFATAFPHRLSGVHRIAWRVGGDQIGKTLKLGYEAPR